MPATQFSSPHIEQPVGLVMVAVATILLVSSLGQTIVSTAIPIIVTDLGGLEHLTWVITAYLLASTVGAPIAGKLGDLYGRKIVLQSAVAIFLIGSIVCGVAENMMVLIVGRALQGVGGGSLMVVAMAVVADVLPARERGRFQGILGGVFGLSTVIGPLIGGFLVEHFSWHWIFFVNLPVGLAALGILAAALKPTGRRVQHKIDYAGAALLAAFLSSIVLTASFAGRTYAWDSVQVLTLIAIAIVSLCLFLWVEYRSPEPILPLQLFAINTFTVTNLVGFIVGIVMFGSITFMPLYLQVVKGVSPTESGLLLLPMMVGLFGASIIAGRVMSSTGRYKLMPILSSFVLAIGMLLLTTLAPETPLWQIMLFVFITGVGIGPIMSIGVTAIQNASPVETLGVATASVNMFRLIGGSLGTAAFGAIFSSGLANSLSHVLPAGSGVATISAEMVATLPDDVRQLVLHSFTEALHPIFWIGASLAAAAFLISFVLEELELATSHPHQVEAQDENNAASRHH